MNISIIGLGKLGSPMAACYAAKGHRVFGVDLNEHFVKCINEKKPPVFETGLAEMLAKTGDKLTATTCIEDAVAQTDITFVIVPTPSEPSGGFALKFALAACQSIGEGMKRKKGYPPVSPLAKGGQGAPVSPLSKGGQGGYHLVSLTSTVMPGATGGDLLPALEKASGKKCPKDFGLCYSPEFISLGSVIRDLLNPDFLLIGETDPKAGATLEKFYKTVYDNTPPVSRMTLVNAELTKLAVNTFVTTKISYANMLAEMCERMDGGNIDQVTSALGLDTRIGAKYLKGSLGYGGPCFPRDNIALSALADRLGVPAPIPKATDRINQHQVPRLCSLIKSCLPSDGCVGILGLSYKPQTNVIERAQGLEIAQALLEEGISVAVFDPCAMDNARQVLHGPVQFAGSSAECVRKADVVLVANPCKEFKDVPAQDYKSTATVIDCWRMLDREKLSRTCTYVGLGTCDVLHTCGMTEREQVLKMDRSRQAA